MTSRDFCYWLQGFFEISEAGSPGTAFTLSAAGVACARNHLAMVFRHEIDPSHGDAAHQAELSLLHEGGGIAALWRVAEARASKAGRPVLCEDLQAALLLQRVGGGGPAQHPKSLLEGLDPAGLSTGAEMTSINC